MLKIPQPLFSQLRAHGEETYPHECCGIILGKSDGDNISVHELLRAGNTRTDSAHNRYHIAPQELIAAQRQARKSGLDIVGFYHSHPDHPAQWSPTDFAEAHWFGCAYVITSVDGDKTTGHAKITNSFLLTGSSEDDKAFVNQPIEILPPESSLDQYVADRFFRHPANPDAGKVMLEILDSANDHPPMPGDEL